MTEVKGRVTVRKKSEAVWTITLNNDEVARFLVRDDVGVAMLLLAAQHLADKLKIKSIDFEMSHEDIERVKRIGLPKSKLIKLH